MEFFQNRITQKKRAGTLQFSKVLYVFTYKSNSCEKKKAKNGYTEKPKTFFENKKMETLKKKKIATIDGPHYSPMKKKMGT